MANVSRRCAPSRTKAEKLHCGRPPVQPAACGAMRHGSPTENVSKMPHSAASQLTCRGLLKTSRASTRWI
eukprot:1325939-Pleurochrysis_carterae.AAC.2